MKEITEKIMQKVLEQLIMHNNYNAVDTKIIGNVFETEYENETEYLEVSYDSKTDWTYKLTYEVDKAEVYLKRIAVMRDSDGENN